MKKGLALFNLVSVLILIAVNSLSQIYRWNDTTIGEMSQQYDNLFTPAGYAFSIWGLIFLSLLGFALFCVRRSFFSDKDSEFIGQTGASVGMASLLASAWVIAFIYGYLLLSLALMLGILFYLLRGVIRLNMERWDAPIEILAFVWWPISFFSGWISVATIANFSVFLVKMDLTGSTLTQIVWTMVMITIAVFLNILMINLRNMREFAMVGAWALIAIFIRHQGNYNAIAYYALAGAVILLIAAGIHGYKNRDTNPFNKLKQRLNQ
ncbi:MAG: tryptophan-rich sensory protein [Leeuwenhoekiella sp.]